MNITRKIFDYKGGPKLFAAFIVLFVAERRYQLRRRKAPGLVRVFTNAIVSIPAFTLLRFMFLPLVVRLARANEIHQSGLVHHVKAPALVKTIITFLVLDYSNYLWHVLNHKLPVLWRFHLVHHTDPDLDLSTALRFHFGEMIGSLFFRGAFVLLSGASAINVLVYEIIFEGATQFHHSNTKLPYKLEQALSKVVVTPRMHGIHHSMVKAETDSNYSVIFSWWDRLHLTLRVNVHQDKIVTGVPVYNNVDEMTIGFLLKLPFTNIKKWEAKDDIGPGTRVEGDQWQLAR